MLKKRLMLDRFSSIFVNRKAQVTVFIILGILLLLILILVISLKTEVFVFKTEEVAPLTKGEIETKIAFCIEKVGSEAVDLIGLQGGYIEVPEDIFRDGNAHLKVSPMHVIPYWANGLDTAIPSLEIIKQRIDAYLEENLRSCLFNQELFNETYDIIEKSDISSDTLLNDNGILFNIKWNIEIKDKAGETITELINHGTTSDIKLKKSYEVAKRIVEKEMDDYKLEDITQDLIALGHPDLPSVGFELSCYKKSWEVAKVKQTLLELLRVNIKQLKVRGTTYVEFPEELTYAQNHYTWDIGEQINHPEISVVFNFEETYPYLFAVTPSSAGKMYSSQLGGSDLLSFLCIQNWKFTYDMIYPVKVRVRDETSGYNFNIAFTVHLIKNTPDRSLATARISDTINTPTSELFCASRKVPMTVKTYELVENNQGVSYREDLDDVNISYTCIRYRCDIGQTEYDFANLGFAGLTSNFPYCAGGVLRGEKENYKEATKIVVTRSYEETELDLIPLINVPLNKFTILKHQIVDGNVQPGKVLRSDELALVDLTFNKVIDPETETTEEFHQTSFVKARKYEDLEEETFAELLAQADFTYDLDIKVMTEEKFIGGYQGEWTVNYAELQNANEIILHVFANPDMSDEEMFESLLNMEDLSSVIPEPEIN